MEEEPRILYRILPADKVKDLDKLNALTWPHRVSARKCGAGKLYIPEGVLGSSPFLKQSNFLQSLKPITSEPEWPPDPEL